MEVGTFTPIGTERQNRSPRTHSCGWLNLDLNPGLPGPGVPSPGHVVCGWSGSSVTRPPCDDFSPHRPPPCPSALPSGLRVLSGPLSHGPRPQGGQEGPCVCWTLALCQVSRDHSSHPHAQGPCSASVPALPAPPPPVLSLLRAPRAECVPTLAPHQPHRRPLFLGSLPTLVSCPSQPAFSPSLKRFSEGESGGGGHCRPGPVSTAGAGSWAPSPLSLGHD